VKVTQPLLISAFRQHNRLLKKTHMRWEKMNYES
jgi:hypothetical protein